MAFRPNFKEPLRLVDGDLRVSGRAADGPVPAALRIFVEQGSEVQTAEQQQPPHEWELFLPGAGFTPGPALAFGVEIHVRPFQAASWTQAVTIV